MKKSTLFISLIILIAVSIGLTSFAFKTKNEKVAVSNPVVQEPVQGAITESNNAAWN